MGLEILTLGSSKTYTRESLLGLGSLKGAPCTIKSITEVDGGQKVTFEWTGTSGTKQTSEMTVKNGVSVTGVSDKGNGIFTLLLSDGSESEPIHTVKGDPFTYSDFTAEQLESLRGEKGYSPTITENADNTDSIYRLDVTTADGTFTTPNLKGTNENGDTSNVQLDETLTDNTKAAPAGMVGQMKDDISQLSEDMKALKENGTGLTETSSKLLIKVLRNGLYANDMSEDIDTLENELGANVVSYAITNNLTNATNNNVETSIKEGFSYSASIVADLGYILSNVTVTMGGNDVTSEVYSGGVINIPSVTGNIVITATAIVSETTMYSITNTFTNVSTDNPSTSVAENGGYTANLTANDGYLLEAVTVTMGGVDVTSDVYANGVIVITSVTGNIVITASAIVSGNDDDVQFVEWIETDGTAYIDTEFIPESVYWKYLIGVKYPDGLNENTTFAGVSPKNKTNLAETDYWNFSFSSQQLLEYRTTVRLHAGEAVLKTGDSGYDKDKDDSIITRFTKKPVYIFSTNGSQKLYTDENMQSQPTGGTFMVVSANTDFTTTGAFSNDKHPITSMWLGGNNRSGLSTPTYAPIILYCFKVWDENDTLLVDMHPAKKGLQVGMYDNVRQKFYGNSASSGVITCGEVLG